LPVIVDTKDARNILVWSFTFGTRQRQVREGKRVKEEKEPGFKCVDSAAKMLRSEREMMTTSS
jgi:hypothetical protein